MLGARPLCYAGPSRPALGRRAWGEPPVTNQKAPTFRRSRAGLGFLAGIALAIAGQPVPSFATVPVDLELVLAVDVSGSMDREEAQMQRAGYVSALLDPKVLRAIRAGYHGRIAATYVEWSGWDYNEVITGWRLLDDEESVRVFSDVIAASSAYTLYALETC